MDDDPAFDPIRDDPAFVALMKDAHPDRRYAAVWSSEATSRISGRRPRARRSTRASPGARRDGYRPVAWSVTPTIRAALLARSPSGIAPWSRRQEKDRARRAAGPAAVALIRLGKGNRSGRACSTAPIPGAAASSSTGWSPWGRAASLIVNELGRASTHPGRGPVRPAADDGRHPLRSRGLDATGADPGPGTLPRRRPLRERGGGRSIAELLGLYRERPRRRASTGRPNGPCGDGSRGRGSGPSIRS